ncbi:MAG: helix-hairpin-helix domain-containing protein [Nitrospirales bacterium]
MMKSFAIKAGMLATTVLLVLWIGWPASHDPAPIAAVMSGEGEHQATVPRDEPIPEARPAQPTRSTIPTVVRSKETQGKLDLNRATAEELQNLPGIGPVLAQRVVERRTTHGPFHVVDDLRDVKGIGKKRMNQLRPLVMVGMVTKAEPKRDAKKAKAL